MWCAVVFAAAIDCSRLATPYMPIMAVRKNQPEDITREDSRPPRNARRDPPDAATAVDQVLEPVEDLGVQFAVGGDRAAAAGAGRHPDR